MLRGGFALGYGSKRLAVPNTLEWILVSESRLDLNLLNVPQTGRGISLSGDDQDLAGE
jgi:hypothetical protein